MAETRTLGLVLKSVAYREADKLVTLLSRDAGKLSLVARGVQKPKSRFSALVEPLTLGRFLLAGGKSLHTLVQGEIVKPYSGLKNDITRLSYAQYFCELCDAVLPEHEPSPEVFQLLLVALESLEQDLVPEQTARCFELNLLDLLGYRPALENCRVCGGGGPYRFDLAEGSLVCLNCPSSDAVEISGGSVALMKRFLESGFQRLSVCRMQSSQNKEIQKICQAMLLNVSGKKRFKSLDVLAGLSQFK